MLLHEELVHCDRTWSAALSRFEIVEDLVGATESIYHSWVVRDAISSGVERFALPLFGFMRYSVR